MRNSAYPETLLQVSAYPIAHKRAVPHLCTLCSHAAAPVRPGRASMLTQQRHRIYTVRQTLGAFAPHRLPAAPQQAATAHPPRASSALVSFRAALRCAARLQVAAPGLSQT